MTIGSLPQTSEGHLPQHSPQPHLTISCSPDPTTRIWSPQAAGSRDIAGGRGWGWVGVSRPHLCGCPGRPFPGRGRFPRPRSGHTNTHSTSATQLDPGQSPKLLLRAHHVPGRQTQHTILWEASSLPQPSGGPHGLRVLAVLRQRRAAPNPSLFLPSLGRESRS